MDVKPLVKTLLARNREVMESTMADVDSQHAQWVPPGKAMPLGALYVHVLTAEDFFIQGLLRWSAAVGLELEGQYGAQRARPPRGQPGRLGAPGADGHAEGCASTARRCSPPPTPTSTA
jgi:hypothetical protein